MINSLEKVDIGNVPYYSTITEHEIQVLRDFFTIHYSRVRFYFTQ